MRLSATFDTKAQAQAWSAKVEAEILAGKRTSEGVTNKTLAEGFARYIETVSPTHRGERWESLRLRAFERTMGFSTLPMADITSEQIALWRDKRLKEVSAGTVIRELNLLASVFTVARREWGWLGENPCSNVRRPPTPAHRDRRISESEIEAILATLSYKEGQCPEKLMQEVAIAFLLAIETAMRAGEILSLTSHQIDIKNRVAKLVQTKNGSAREVSLSQRAVDLLGMLPVAENGKCFRVSSASLDALFRKATRRANISNLCFHDTRHEAITRLARKLDVLDLACLTPAVHSR